MDVIQIYYHFYFKIPYFETPYKQEFRPQFKIPYFENP